MLTELPFGPKVPLKQIEYGFRCGGLIICLVLGQPYSIYLRGTINPIPFDGHHGLHRLHWLHYLHGLSASSLGVGFKDYGLGLGAKVLGLRAWGLGFLGLWGISLRSLAEYFSELGNGK